MHDRKLLRLSKVRLKAKTKAGVDSGYQGLQHDHPNTAKPIKNTKRHPLTKEQKKANREQARERILVENVIGSIKRFRILSYQSPVSVNLGIELNRSAVAARASTP